jgi:hypothetical protein
MLEEKKAKLAALGQLDMVFDLVRNHCTADYTPLLPVDKNDKNKRWLKQYQTRAGTVVIVDSSMPNAVYKKVDVSNGVILDGISSEDGFLSGTDVSISAETLPGRHFVRWEGETESGKSVTFSDPSNPKPIIKMPREKVFITAHFKDDPPPPSYAVVVENGLVETSQGSGNGGNAPVFETGGKFVAGQTVKITIGKLPAGMEFDCWTSDNAEVQFKGASSQTTTFVMPATPVNVTARFKLPPPPPERHAVTVVGGLVWAETSENAGAPGWRNTGGLTSGQTVAIKTNEAPANMVFDRWTSNSQEVRFADANSRTTTFVMPAIPVRITACFKPAPPEHHKVTVIGGMVWVESAIAGQTVSIKANEPSSGLVFDKWISDGGMVGFENETSSETSFVMPAQPVRIIAIFKKKKTGYSDPGTPLSTPHKSK